MVFKSTQWIIIITAARAVTEYAPPYHALAIVVYLSFIFEAKQKIGEASNPGPTSTEKMRGAFAREGLVRSFAREDEARARKEPVEQVRGRPTRSDSLPRDELRTRAKNIQSRKMQGELETKELPKTPGKLQVGSPHGTPDSVARSVDAEAVRGRPASTAAGQKADEPEAPAEGKVLRLLDGVASHEAAIRLVVGAKELIRMYGFTFDREDIDQALRRARKRSVDMMMGVDRKYSLNGRAREQLDQIKKVSAHGESWTSLGGFR